MISASYIKPNFFVDSSPVFLLPLSNSTLVYSVFKCDEKELTEVKERKLTPEETNKARIFSI